MKKQQMVKEVTERTNDIFKEMTGKEDVKFSQAMIEAVLKGYSDCVLENLTTDKEEKIPMPGVGTFSAKYVKEKSGVAALADNKPWTVPEHYEIKFSISKAVKTLA